MVNVSKKGAETASRSNKIVEKYLTVCLVIYLVIGMPILLEDIDFMNRYGPEVRKSIP